jgi:hypothetical protein
MRTLLILAMEGEVCYVTFARTATWNLGTSSTKENKGKRYTGTDILGETGVFTFRAGFHQTARRQVLEGLRRVEILIRSYKKLPHVTMAAQELS